MGRSSYDRHQPSQQGVSLYDFVEGQSAIERLVADLYEKTPFLDGSLLAGVELTTGQNLVQHKLGRELRGWFKLRDSVAPVEATVFRDASLTMTDSANTKLSMDTVQHQIGSAWSETNSRFEAPHNGLYEASFQWRGSGFADAERAIAYLFVNGGAALRSLDLHTGAAGSHGGQVAGVLELEAEDYVEPYYFQTTGAALEDDFLRNRMTVKALIGLFDQQIGHNDQSKTLKLFSQCDRTVDLLVF